MTKYKLIFQMTTDSRTASHLRNEQPISYLRELRLFLLNKEKFQNEKTKLMMLTVIFGTQLRCQTTNSPIRAWNIYESSPFSRKKFLSLCSIVKTTEWNGLIKIDN